MLSLRSAAKCAFFVRPMLAAAAFQPAAGQCPNAFVGFRTLPEPEFRCGLSLARNDAFTPFRGQRSRPAPSTPHRIPSRGRSIPGSFAPFGFEADPGRSHRPTPVSRADLRRSRDFSRPPLPFRPFRARQINAFSRIPPHEARLPGLRSPLTSRCDLFRSRPGYACGPLRPV